MCDDIFDQKWFVIKHQEPSRQQPTLTNFVFHEVGTQLKAFSWQVLSKFFTNCFPELATTKKHPHNNKYHIHSIFSGLYVKVVFHIWFRSQSFEIILMDPASLGSFHSSCKNTSSKTATFIETVIRHCQVCSLQANALFDNFWVGPPNALSYF